MTNDTPADASRWALSLRGTKFFKIRCSFQESLSQTNFSWTLVHHFENLVNLIKLSWTDKAYYWWIKSKLSSSENPSSLGASVREIKWSHLPPHSAQCTVHSKLVTHSEVRLEASFLKKTRKKPWKIKNKNSHNLPRFELSLS